MTKTDKMVLQNSLKFQIFKIPSLLTRGPFIHSVLQNGCRGIQEAKEAKKNLELYDRRRQSPLGNVTAWEHEQRGREGDE